MFCKLLINWNSHKGDSLEWRFRKLDLLETSFKLFQFDVMYDENSDERSVCSNNASARNERFVSRFLQ